MTGTGQAEFRIRGMDCAEEIAILKRAVGPIVGGEENLAFDLLQGKMIVRLPGSEIPVDRIRRAVSAAGLEARVWEEEDGTAERSARRLRALATSVSGFGLVSGFLLHGLSGGFSQALGAGEGVIPFSVRALYLLAVVSGGWYIFPKAWFSLRGLRPDMNLLMTIAVAGAIGIQQWLEAATVAFLFALSILLEAWSVGRARRAVEALMDLAAPTARLRSEDGPDREVDPRSIAVGARIFVRPGERIPLDGRVCAGSSEVNQAPITGESLPVAKTGGDEVFAGTINGDGALEIETTREAADTTLAHIIRMVGEAQRQRAPSEQWVERFARYYTPSVMGLAVAALLIPPLLLAAPWEPWIYRSLVFLVIGCPCALVISTPVSIVAALASSARHGVLIKGGLFVEVPSQVKALAFDKTGTLTEGKPSVVEIVGLDGHSEMEILQRAASLEVASSHPVARAILSHAHSRKVSLTPITDFQALQGKGATGRFEGRDFWVGSHRYLEERGQETPEIHAMLEELSRAGRTVVVVGNQSHVCGFIALADELRPRVRETLEELKAAGVRHLVMLTGDNPGTAEAIARATGVQEVYADLLPGDKVEAIERLVSEYGKVAMVGDGVNDAPAMARASLGIAMGAAGSDAAIEASDIALMSDDLAKLPWLIRHSRRTLRIIRQNITISIAVKVLFAALTFRGEASLWAAIAADTGVSLLVIFNALRLLGR